MYPILQIGPLAIQLPGLLLLAGLWIGTQLAERGTARNKLDPLWISNMIFIALAAGVIGARLGYALKYLDLYLREPLNLLALNPNTLSTMEGIAVGLIAAMIYAQRKGLSLLPTIDRAVMHLGRRPRSPGRLKYGVQIDTLHRFTNS